MSPAINNRLTQYAENLAGEYQNGVRIIELVLTMCYASDTCKMLWLQYRLYVLYIAFKHVFDTVSREKGLQRSQEIGMLNKIKTSNW